MRLYKSSFLSIVLTSKLVILSFISFFFCWNVSKFQCRSNISNKTVVQFDYNIVYLLRMLNLKKNFFCKNAEVIQNFTLRNGAEGTQYNFCSCYCNNVLGLKSS